MTTNEGVTVQYRLAVSFTPPGATSMGAFRIAPAGDMRVHYLPGPDENGHPPPPTTYDPTPLWEAMRDGLIAAGFTGTTLERIDTRVQELT